MKNKALPKIGQRAFSLVELLVVIAVIAIIAAIAIPNIANITGQAQIAKDQRNAQNIASVASAAIAAGHNPDPAWADATAVYTALVAGVTVGTGANRMEFGISPLSADEQDGAFDYITVTTTAGGSPVVNYNPGGPSGS